MIASFWTVATAFLLGTITPDDPAREPLPEFDRIVIDSDFPDAYQVEVADVDGDGKLDVVAVGGGTVAWYQNPSWTKRIITGPDTTPGVISSATRDLDGDGKAEIAIAYDFEMNEPKRGKLLLAIQGRGIEDAWTTRDVAHLGSIHRIRWGDWDGDGRPDLFEAPIFGPGAKPPSYDQEGSEAVLSVGSTGRFPKLGIWTWRPITSRPILHAIEVLDVDGDGKDEVFTADNLGASMISQGLASEHHAEKTATLTFQLFPGAEGPAPKRGASEIHNGKLSGGRSFLATIEPWHGNKVVVHPGPLVEGENSPPAVVLDDTLDEGHALWVVDIDGDGDDEIFAGHRGKDHRVSAYDFDGENWVRTVLDHEVAAQDLRGGDLDGDGTPDVVAVGGSTHNVLWYRPRPAATR